MTQVYVFSLPENIDFNTQQENHENPESVEEGAHWDLDDRLIDYDMLVAEPEEADKIYQELKERALRRKRIEAKEAKIEEVMMEEEEEDDTPDSI